MMDPLAQLRDIHLPSPVDAWPPAPGWWLLAALLAAALITLGFYAVRRYRRNAYRRAALAQWHRLQAQYLATDNGAHYLMQLNALVKKAALTCYGPEQVASLSDSAWLQFLDTKVKAPLFNQDTGLLLARAPYQTPHQLEQVTPHIQAIADLCRRWLEEHA